MATLAAEGGYNVQETLDELVGISWNEWKYLCRVMTFSTLTAPPRLNQGEARMAFPELSGRVSIYRSKNFLGLSEVVDGQPTIALDPTDEGQPVNVDRVLRAWNFLRLHNPLYANTMFEEPEDTGALSLGDNPPTNIEELAEDVPRPQPVNRQGFDTEFLMEIDPGPRAANQDLENINTGFDLSENELVRYGNPDLLPMLFPDLYPLGTGPFKLHGQDRNLVGQIIDNNGEEDVNRDVPDEGDNQDLEGDGAQGVPGGAGAGRVGNTLKDYVKYRLQHFCRRWAKNTRFIAFMSDWNIKKATSGYHMRTTSMRRGERPTTVADVLTSKFFFFG